jgi:hypothetical protein
MARDRMITIGDFGGGGGMAVISLLTGKAPV